MVLKLYNTLTKKIEEFIHPKGRPVLYYTCGPTVHDYAHIGNFRTFVVQDVLKRWLEASGHNVRHIMNITDVDEKTIERAARQKIPLVMLTEKYEKAFFEDLDCLNIKEADHYPRVSENMEAIAAMVGGLYEKGHVIRDKDGSYYFDINSFHPYGRLSGQTPSRTVRALMPREDYKAPKNFLLWKLCETDHGLSCFDSPLGKGLPGWHIECATLSQRYLGPSIDIHSGGIDLIFPHHENEIAESEAFSEERFSRFWVHVAHLEVFGKKMSKSLGNFFTLRQIIKKGYDPRAMRLLYLKTHYRSTLNFDFDKLKKAQKEIFLLDGVVKKLQETKNSTEGRGTLDIPGFKNGFSVQMDDDLHTGYALHLFFDFLRDVKVQIEKDELLKHECETIMNVIFWVDSVFDLLEGCESTQ
jgi:cysteinyl-tRNA synthetase